MSEIVLLLQLKNDQILFSRFISTTVDQHLSTLLVT